MSADAVSGLDILRLVAENTQSKEFVVTAIAAQMTPVVDANPSRYAIGFSTTALGGLIVTTDNDIANNFGIDVKFPGIVWLNVKDHASYCQSAFNVRGRGTNNDLTVIEITYLR